MFSTSFQKAAGGTSARLPLSRLLGLLGLGRLPAVAKSAMLPTGPRLFFVLRLLYKWEVGQVVTRIQNTNILQIA